MSIDDTDPSSPEDSERRSFMQGMVLGGLVLSHSTGGSDGGWFDDWFGGSDDGPDAPGFFTDVQYRHEDEVVIDDPKIVDFVGDALDVKRPNHYDKGIRIKVDGDVAVAGEDIAPKSVITGSVDADSLNNVILVNPDGSNDATKVQDAIDNRPNNETVIIPNPGVDLDWDKKVTLPANEYGFTLATWGSPTLNIPTGFSENYAIQKPSTTSNSFRDVGRYYIGPMRVYDEGRNLTHAFQLDDIKSATIDRPVADRCPGIELKGTNATSANNTFIKPFMFVSSGTGIKFGANANANTVFHPVFNNSGSATETAYNDQGEWNTWIHTRVEDAAVPHVFGGSNYKLVEGNWDNLGSYTYTVKEEGDVSGTIWLQNRREAFEKLALCNGGTEVFMGSEPGLPANGPIDYLDRTALATQADTLSDLGLVDISTGGGSVSIQKTWERLALRLNTGSTSGDTAAFDMGGGVFDVEALAPKANIPLHVAAGTSAVIARCELRADASNRFGFVYDPGNTLGNHPNSNWYFEVETGGLVDGRTDTGVSPSSNGFNRLSFGYTGDNTFTGYVDGGFVDTITAAGTVGDAELHVYLETAEASNKRYVVRTSRGGRLLTT